MQNRYFKTIIRHFLIWTFAISFWSVMRQFGQDVMDEPTFQSFGQLIGTYLSIGFIAGVSLGNFEYFFEKFGFLNKSFGKAVLIGAVSYTIIIYMLVFIGISIFSIGNGDEINWSLYQNFLFSSEMLLLIFYFFFVGLLVHLIKQIDRKFGPGNLWKMLTGKFYSPKEVERIFMFLDLKSSTSIAEKLGHIRYSNLIQDCFQDLSIVRKYQAEIYQYVGDEVVLTWNKNIGISDFNCLKAFFVFKARLVGKSDYYLHQYGLVPEFKAGLNIGQIVMAEVGQIKREIAYHGDTINTASRIQEACSNFGKELLISEDLYQNLDKKNGFNMVQIGDILLKGKTRKVKIYSVENSVDDF